MTRHAPLAVFYDRPVDVLHVVAERGVPYEGDGRAAGVELDFSIDGDRPVGAKVIGFHHFGWEQRLNELAQIIGKHLSVSENELARAIREKTVAHA